MDNLRKFSKCITCTGNPTGLCVTYDDPSAAGGTKKKIAAEVLCPGILENFSIKDD